MDVRIWFFGGPNDGEFVGVAQDLTTLKIFCYMSKVPDKTL